MTNNDETKRDDRFWQEQIKQGEKHRAQPPIEDVREAQRCLPESKDNNKYIGTYGLHHKKYLERFETTILHALTKLEESMK